VTNYVHYQYSSGEPQNAAVEGGIAQKIAGILATRLVGGKEVCDIGCGNGYLAGRLVEAGFLVTGVDASPSGIAIATKTLGDKAEFVCRPIDQSLPALLGHCRFDAVISSDVIEHLYRPSEIVESAFDLLKDRGWLVICTPYHGYWKNLALSIFNRWDAHHGVDWDGGHIKFFSPATLSRLVEASGFAVDEFAYFGRMPFLWKNMICVAQKNPWGALVK
jgi:2-polyprenyl-3-methyl-5-hydroxy-6-metoxy-1,4-benzoquinol methylase